MSETKPIYSKTSFWAALCLVAATLFVRNSTIWRGAVLTYLIIFIVAWILYQLQNHKEIQSLRKTLRLNVVREWLSTSFVLIMLTYLMLFKADCFNPYQPDIFVYILYAYTAGAFLSKLFKREFLYAAETFVIVVWLSMLIFMNLLHIDITNANIFAYIYYIMLAISFVISLFKGMRDFPKYDSAIYIIIALFALKVVYVV